MSKKLSELTLEELWMLFPITLTEHNDEWKKQYMETASFLEKKQSPPQCHSYQPYWQYICKQHLGKAYKAYRGSLTGQSG